MTEEKRIPDKNEPRLYRANPRGIGRGWTNGCMVCGDGNHDQLVNDCSFFVPSRETGEAIAAMLPKGGAYLDYRRTEPQWIQVKIGACDEHLSALESLVRQVRATADRNDGPGISVEMLNELIPWLNR